MMLRPIRLETRNLVDPAYQFEKGEIVHLNVINDSDEEVQIIKFLVRYPDGKITRCLDTTEMVGNKSRKIFPFVFRETGIVVFSLRLVKGAEEINLVTFAEIKKNNSESLG